MTRRVRLQRLPGKEEILGQVALADTFWTRFQGWMGRSTIGPQDALLLLRTPAIHTWFMRRPIDVVILSKNGEVLAVRASVVPWRMLSPMAGAGHALELGAGGAERLSIRVGDHLGWEPDP